MERRWSVVGASWSKKKPSIFEKNQPQQVKQLPPVISLPCIQSLSVEEQHANSDSLKIDQSFFLNGNTCEPNQSFFSDSDEFVRIPKSEYEAIKDRVSAIETRISQEFSNVHASLASLPNSVQDDQVELSSGPANVLDKYEKTLENTEEFANTSSTDLLAKRLSRELKIRRSFDSKVIRSPSARKIGTMRRRSRENIRLSRNQSWHLGTTKPSTVISNSSISAPIQNPTLELSTCTKTNLKRGRPNTVQSGLRHPSPTKKSQHNDDLFVDIENTVSDVDMKDEKWINAEQFFDISKHRQLSGKNLTALNEKLPIPFNEIKTPMLPPRLPPKKTPSNTTKTPFTSMKSEKSDRLPTTKSAITPLPDHQTGRASIARLRSQNAGMVAAKAKLFGGMATEMGEIHRYADRRESSRFSTKFSLRPINVDTLNVPPNPIIENFKKQHRHRTNSKSPSKSSPRRERKIDKCPNGVQRRQKLRHMKSPSKNSPAKLKTVVTSKGNRISGTMEVTNHSRNKKQMAQINADIHAIIHETCTPDKRTMNNLPNCMQDNYSTPQIKRALIEKSPRRILKTPNHDTNFHKRRSPMRATPIKLRHSPRLQFHGNNMGH